jgi:hypothetical protein
LKFEIRGTKSETNPNVKYQMLETGAADRLVRYPRVSGERRVFGCLFWTFDFAILNLFRISDFEIRIWFRFWLRP